MSKTIFAVFSIASLLTLAGCGNSTDPMPSSAGPATPVVPTSTTAVLLTLSASPTSVPSDNTANTTVTVTALNSTNAALPDVQIILGTDTGVVSPPTVTTGATGTATFTFSSGVGNLANRTATVTATAGVATAQIPIQISGSTLTVLSGNNQTVPDNGSSSAPVVFVAKNAQGTGVANAAISVVASGLVTLTPASGVTDSAGKFTTSVAGNNSGVGAATVTATAVGSTAAATINVTPSATTFTISQTQLNAATPVLSPTAASMTTADQLTVTVAAPAGTTLVTFATSIGTWIGGTNLLANVPVAGGIASATLTTTSAGVASVQALDPLNPTLSDSLTVSMTAVTPNAVTLQATPSVVAKSVGTTAGSATLIATVVDVNGQPVGNAPVAFSIINPTGGGETVSPVIAYTASTAGGGLTLGQALASFTSGSLTSGAGGVQIRATVLGTSVQTEPSGVSLTDSGNDASIVIGGTAGSVAFGSATVLSVNANATAYIQAMSVLVADANGTPAPIGTVVNLSLWPIAWSTGTGCFYDGDGLSGTTGTFLNEDVNENTTLDTGEDGTRKYYATGTTSTTSYSCILVGGVRTCTAGAPITSATGTTDSAITPANSAAGTLTSANAADAPGTVTTDANGVGSFNLTYGKNSALWTVVRIRASTIVAGSAAVGELQFRLAALANDVVPCRLPDSPYNF